MDQLRQLVPFAVVSLVAYAGGMAGWMSSFEPALDGPRAFEILTQHEGARLRGYLLTLVVLAFFRLVATSRTMNENQVARWGHIRSRGMARFLTPIAVGWTFLMTSVRLLVDLFNHQPIAWPGLVSVGIDGVAGVVVAYGLWWFYDRQWLTSGEKQAVVSDSQA